MGHASLNKDVVSLVIEFCCMDCPLDFLNLLFVCKEWHTLLSHSAYLTTHIWNRLLFKKWTHSYLTVEEGEKQLSPREAYRHRLGYIAEANTLAAQVSPPYPSPPSLAQIRTNLQLRHSLSLIYTKLQVTNYPYSLRSETYPRVYQLLTSGRIESVQQGMRTMTDSILPDPNDEYRRELQTVQLEPLLQAIMGERGREGDVYAMLVFYLQELLNVFGLEDVFLSTVGLWGQLLLVVDSLSIEMASGEMLGSMLWLGFCVSTYSDEDDMGRMVEIVGVIGNRLMRNREEGGGLHVLIVVSIVGIMESVVGYMNEMGKGEDELSLHVNNGICDVMECLIPPFIGSEELGGDNGGDGEDDDDDDEDENVEATIDGLLTRIQSLSIGISRQQKQCK